MHKLYSDTAIYGKQAAALIKYVGVDNVLFASELIGAANAIDPETGVSFDHTKRYVDAIEWLTHEHNLEALRRQLPAGLLAPQGWHIGASCSTLRRENMTGALAPKGGDHG